MLIRSKSSKPIQKSEFIGIIPNKSDFKPIQSSIPIELPYKLSNKTDMRNEVPLRSLQLFKSNIPTISKEYNIEKRNGDEECNENFASHFYMNSMKKFDRDYETSIRERIIQEYKKENPNAFEIAKLMLNKYLCTKLLEYQNLERNKAKAQTRVVIKKSNDQQKKFENNKIQKTKVKKLYNTMKKAIEHILDQSGEKKFERMEKKLQEKESLTLEMFQKKSPNIATKTDLNGKLRLLMSKKTDELQIFREIGSSLKLDSSSSELVKELKEMSESGLDLSVVSSKGLSRLSRYTEEMKRQKEREEDKKIEKYFDIHKLQDKYKENDKDKIQQIIRRALVRDTLKEHERIRLKGATRIEKQNEEKVEELKKISGISCFAVSKNDVKEAKSKINISNSPTNPAKNPSSVNNLGNSLKKLSYKPEKTKTVLFHESIKVSDHLLKTENINKNQGNQVNEKHNNIKVSSKMQEKAWQKGMKKGKDTEAKTRFFQLDSEVPKSEIFKRTLCYSGLFEKKMAQNYRKLKMDNFEDNREIFN